MYDRYAIASISSNYLILDIVNITVLSTQKSPAKLLHVVFGALIILYSRL